MWARAWKRVQIPQPGFARIQGEFALSISRIGHRNPRRVTRSCSGKAPPTGKTFSKQPKVEAEWSITCSSRKAAGFRKSKPRAAACSLSGSFVRNDGRSSESFVRDLRDSVSERGQGRAH